MKTFNVRIVCIIMLLIFCSSALYAQDVIRLPEPKIRGQLMKALKNRVSFKGFSTKELSAQRLSELLWAGFGINDTGTGRRTASSAFNAQEIDMYVLTAQGVCRYDASGHNLVIVSRKDIRHIVATQGYVKSAPVHVMYVADFERANEAYPDRFEKEAASWAMMHTGFIAQNIELYCTVHDMTAVVRLAGDRDRLSEELKLGSNQRIIVSQAIGYVPER